MKRSLKIKALSITTMLVLIASVMMWFPAVYSGQSVSYTYQAVNRNLAANGSYCGQQVSCNVIGSGAQYHQLTWNKVGTVSACSVTVDTSADNVSWSSGGAITAKDCSANGTSTSTSVVANYVRMTVASFAGTGTVALNLTGFLNSPSSGGSVSSLTATAPVVATPSPIVGVGVFSCPTCIVAPVNPVAGVAHFAGSTQTATSSPVVNADVTSIDAAAKLTGLVPPANGGVAVISASGQGGFWGGLGLVGAYPSANTTSSVIVASNNQVRFVTFPLTGKVTIGQVTALGGAAAGTGDLCIYNITGTTLLANTGAQTYSNNAFKNTALAQGSVTFNPGVYLFAFTATVNTASWSSFVVNTGYFATSTAQYGIAGNAATAGVCPATLGTLTKTATAAQGMPGAFFEP